jgi:hypothetical protein
MPVIYERPKPLIKRAPTIADTSAKILRFDSDNLYPQRAEETIRRSATLKSLMSRIADFVNGEGFLDPVIAGLILNRKGLNGQSANKVLGIVSNPFVRYRCVPMHVGYNLLGAICSLTPLPFETIRFGLRGKDGCINYLAYSANWEKDGRSGNEQNIVFYDAFNPNPEVVLQQIAKAGGIANYKGQIIYHTPEDGQYPLATFDAVWDDAQVQNEVGLFKIGNTQNSFLATLAILYPGEYGSKQEETDFNDLISNKKGSRNAGSTIGIQDKTGQRKASDIFMPLTPENLDKLFEYTETSVKENIIESEAFPQILLGKSPTGLFAQGDIEEAYTYVNAITRNRRAELSEFFSTVLKYWQDPIITDAAIIEQRYVLQSDPGSGGIDINDNLKNMTGMQAINFERILRKYEQGKYTRAIATQMLQGGFGLSLDEINKLLDGIDQLLAEENAAAPEAAPAAATARLKKVKSFIVAMQKEML